MAVAQNTFFPNDLTSTTSDDVTEEKDGIGFFSKIITCLLELCYEPAKELCDREEKAAELGSLWYRLFRILHHLIAAEKGYYSLSFLERSWMFKRETQKTTASYESMLLRLQKLQEAIEHERENLDSCWLEVMLAAVRQLPEFAATRTRMIAFYTQLSQQGRSYIDSQQAQKELHRIQEEFKDSLSSPHFAPLKELVMREISVLLNLFSAHQFLGEWELLPSLTHLVDTHNKINKWMGIQSPGTAGEKKQGVSLMKSVQHPQGGGLHLYEWFCRLFTALMAKFSFYFHCVLSENATAYDMKSLSLKLEPDLMTRCRIAIGQSNLECICTIFSTDGLQDFKGPGYHLPTTPPLELRGVSSFPVMVRIPKDYPLGPHIPNIISVLFQHVFSGKISLSSIICQPDEKLSCTYFILPVDLRVFLVGICASPKTGKHSKAQASLNDLATHLRLAQITALLIQK